MASSRVDAHQVKLAVAALANFLRDREKRREDKGEARDLFDSGDVPLQLVIALKRIPDSYSAKLHSV